MQAPSSSVGDTPYVNSEPNADNGTVQPATAQEPPNLATNISQLPTASLRADENGPTPNSYNFSAYIGAVSERDVADQLKNLVLTENGDDGQIYISPQERQATEHWHATVTADLRNHLVHKLVTAIYPCNDPPALLEERLRPLIAYATKVEGDIYDRAATRSEYYHLMAEKTYRIQKELEERVERRRERQQQQQ